MRWYEHHRMEWIGETLRVFGYINREHLMKKFGLSVPQASHDLQAFQKARPGEMEYDKRAKRYVARSTNERGVAISVGENDEA